MTIAEGLQRQWNVQRAQWQRACADTPVEVRRAVQACQAQLTLLQRMYLHNLERLRAVPIRREGGENATGES